MLRNSFVGCGVSLALACLLGAAETTAPSRSQLSAAAIVERNVTARGGLQAWRSVQTMSLEGKLGAGGNKRAVLPVPGASPEANKQALAARPAEEVFLPFVMELKRPRKLRLELQFKGQTAVQVFDGSNGWKLRPFLNRRVVEPYTSSEMKLAATQADLDGYLVDYSAKGTRVELAGTETVEGRDTYNLKLTLKNGEVTHVWIDSQTFLETKVQGQPRVLDGISHPVEVYFRDYRPVNGLEIPFLLETRVLLLGQTAMGLKDPVIPSEKTIIEKVVVNPKLEEALFSKPEIELASNAR